MERNSKNLRIYRLACQEVLKRASGRCEAMIDGKRCGRYLGEDSVPAICFAHTETRNGKSDEWINDPENITLTCPEHHIAEHQKGEKIVRCEHEEIEYIIDPQ